MVKIFCEWWEDNCMQYQYSNQILRDESYSYSKPMGSARKFVTSGFWEFVLLKVPQAFSYVILNAVATAIKLEISMTFLKVKELVFNKNYRTM